MAATKEMANELAGRPDGIVDFMRGGNTPDYLRFRW